MIIFHQLRDLMSLYFKLICWSYWFFDVWSHYENPSENCVTAYSNFNFTVFYLQFLTNHRYSYTIWWLVDVKFVLLYFTPINNSLKVNKRFENDVQDVPIASKTEDAMTTEAKYQIELQQVFCTNQKVTEILYVKSM